MTTESGAPDEAGRVRVVVLTSDDRIGQSTAVVLDHAGFETAWTSSLDDVVASVETEGVRAVVLHGGDAHLPSATLRGHVTPIVHDVVLVAVTGDDHIGSPVGVDQEFHVPVDVEVIAETLTQLVAMTAIERRTRRGAA
jgi:hypothetical protein